MNSLQIEYFLALAEHKNFTNTAKALFVSQPAISKQIAGLEKELGFSLFFRSNRNVTLTPAGMIFLKAFTEASEIYKNAMKQAKDIYGEKSRRLRLGCVDGMEIGNLLNKIFISFHEHFPNVEYQLERHSPNNLIKLLNNDELDAIITLESFLENNPNLSSSVFLVAKHLLYVPANHPALYKKSFDLSDFKDETFIILSPEALPGVKDSFYKWCEENGFTPKNVKYAPNVESQMLSVEVGIGITIGDPYLRLYNNPLIKSIELNTSHNICFAWKKDSPNLLIQSFAKLASQINNPAN
jgi:DNA-binding transcriptional LysR family regulator